MPARLELPSEHPHVALVTIDRPEKANSLDPATLAELAAAWRRIAEATHGAADEREQT